MSNDQMSAINAALAKAREAAAQAAPAAGQVPAVVSNSNTAPALVGGPRVSMREMVAETGVRPDCYLKVTPFGFTVGKDTTKTILDELPVEFRIDQARPFWGLRYGQTPAVYKKSFDRIVESRSKRPWADVCAEGGRADPRCTGDFPALELNFVATEDIMSKDGKVVLCAKGKTMGWTSSITNWSEWAAFIEPIYTLIDAGLLPANALAAGKIKHVARSGGGNEWGNLSFAEIELADFGGEEKAAA